MTEQQIPKLAIRQDDEEGVIRAYISRMDDSQRFEIATLSLEVARNAPGAFDRWKDCISEIFTQILKDNGVPVTGTVDVRPHEKG